MSKVNDAILNKFSLPKTEKIINQIPCSLIDFSFGVMYITTNHICFSSVIYYGKNIVIPYQEILSIKISKDQNKILISTLAKIYRKSFLIFSNFSDIKKSFEIIDKNVYQGRMNNLNKYHLGQLNSLSSRNEYSNSILKTENKEKKNENFFKKFSSSTDSGISSEEEIEEDEIKFVEINNESVLICLKEINLSSTEFFTKFFYSKDPQNDFSFPKFYETLEDHFDIKVTEWKDVNLKNEKDKYSKERNISFNLKLKGLPFINESKVFSTQKITIDEKNKIYIINSISKSEGVPFSNYFEIKDQYEIYPLNENSCVLRVTGYPFFIEETFLKIAIQTATKNTFKNDNEKWLNYVKSNGVDYLDYCNKKVIRKKKIDYCVAKTCCEEDNENFFFI